MLRQSATVVGLVAAFALLVTGCGASPEKAKQTAEATKVSEGREHGEWWCSEHGMPEEVCAQCSTELAAEFKAKGDWCQEHDRPDSQCFICHPELEAKFAAQYEAKYGAKPPKPEEGGEGHEHHDHQDKS